MSAARKLAFALCVWIAFFAMIEGLFALAGVKPDVDRDDPYVGFASNLPLFVPGTDEAGAPEWRTAPNKLRFFNDQQFAKSKPVGSRRLFCLGGSTTYGRPYFDGTSFCGWLRALLPAADAGSAWEVVNAGGVSYASYRVAALLPELTRYEPDLLVVYTGHNEFLEERTYAELRDRNALLTRIESALRHTRIDAVLRRLIEPARRGGREVLSGEVSTLLDRSVGPAAYERDDALRDQVVAHYRYNLERIIRLARDVGATPLLVVPASNLRSCSPFKSTHSEGLAASAQEAWQATFELGRRRQSDGDVTAARDAYADAVAIDPRRADGQYALGQTELLLGETVAAERSLKRARDEDVCPLRAISLIPAIVREVASEQGVPMVDFEQLVERRVASARGYSVPGEDWFLDHVHPTVEGHRQLALSLLDAMRDQGIIEPKAGWGETEIERITLQVLAGIDEHEHGLALRNLAKVLSWAGKSRDAASIARRALRKLGEDAECHFILGVEAAEGEHWEEAAAEYRQAVSLEPGYLKARNNLGTALVRLGRDNDAIAEYEQVLARDPGHASARFNLGNALLRQGRIDAAIAQYREVLREDPADTDARFNLARAYARRGEWTQAAVEYRRLLEFDPEDPDANEELAAALERLEPR